MAEMEEMEEVKDVGVIKTAKKVVDKSVGIFKSTKKKLDAMKKVSVKIPVDNLNPNDKFLTVQINGYTFNIQRGIEVEVPLAVKKILEKSKHI